MFSLGENTRFYLPVAALVLFAAYCSVNLVLTHIDADVTAPKYDFNRSLPGTRGSIYDKGGASSPLAKSVPVWEYRLDPVSLTNTVVRRRGEPPRKPKAILRTVADVLHLELVHQVHDGSHRAAGGQQVVVDQHHIVGGEGILMDLDTVEPVFLPVGGRQNLGGQLARLAGRHETGTQADGQGRSQHQTAGFDPDDLGNAFVLVDFI